MEQYIMATNHINKVLDRQVDTTQISEQLPQVEMSIEEVRGRLERRNRDINLRYLNALNNFTDYQTRRIEKWKVDFDSRSAEVLNAFDSLREIKKDKILSLTLEDPTILPAFQSQLKELQTRIRTGDSLFVARQLNLVNYQSRLSNVLIAVNDFKEEIRERERKMERALFNKEINFIWDKSTYSRTKELLKVVSHSVNINRIILKGYVEATRPVLIWVLGLILAFFLWFRYLLRHIKSEKEFSDIILQRTRFIPNNPLLSAMVIVLPLATFFYRSPPVVLVVVVLWLLMLVTTVLIRSIVKKKIYLFWWVFLVIFVIYSISNLYIETAYEERWVLLFLSFVCIGLAYSIISEIKDSGLNHTRYVILLIQLFMIIQGLSAVANVLGRYSLAKILGVAATTSLMQAVGLYVFVLVILEAIYLQIEMGKKSTTEYTAYFDFQDIQSKVRNIFVFLAAAIWLYYLTTNLTIYDYLFENISAFLSKERKIGQSTFNFGSISTFIIIIWISGIISKYISYFAEAKDQKMAANRKQRLGSSILLIKLAVFTLGFLLAITAAGIPLDNVAIVLGALSVGIGFGLQTIINNLVSGIILAFERPVQIGDVIEVGGQSGVVKEVGIRASKIQGWDGSELIMPNGDLLSQQLINWTLSNKRRRIELFIGVAYGSDSDKVEGVFKKVLDREDILKVPGPSVFLQNFAESAVEYRLLFWVNDIDIWVDMRNEVMKDIYKRFGEENIEIPFPQRDLYIKSMPESKSAQPDKKDIPPVEKEQEKGGRDSKDDTSPEN
ncbi:mechanosensitive ion channel family protein [Echinicola soli]|nr:mechanosensitive ion channel domain-containing protein [Echinicola soli]